MDAHDLLIADHKTLRAQADVMKGQIEANSPKLAATLANYQALVTKHFTLEDIYFRMLDRDKRVADRSLIHQLRNDHAAVIFALESLVIRLRKYGMSPDWRTRYHNMMAVFLPHLDTEEKQLFSLGRTVLSPAELADILKQMQNDE